VHEAAAESLLSAGRRLFDDSDRHLARSAVEATFRNLILRLQHGAPEASRSLAEAQFSKAQQEAVLNALRLVGDAAVQHVGMDVARAMRGSSSGESEQLRHDIERQLQPRAGKLLELRDRLVPAELRSLWGDARPWASTLDPQNVRVMQAGGSLGKLLTEGEEIAVQGSSEHPRRRGVRIAAAEKAAAISAGAREEARVLLGMLARVADLPTNSASLVASPADADADHHVVRPPPRVEGMERVLVDGPAEEPLSCEAGSSQGRASRAMLCALKFGAQGLDALRASPRMAHALPDSAFGADGDQVEISSIGFA